MNWPTFGRIMCHLPRSGDRRLHAPRLEHLRKLRCILVDEEKKPSIKLDADEKELLASVERGEWKSAAGGTRERARYSRYAKATFRKDRPLNIRLSRKDLEAIQKRACAEGLPSQTLISSLLHKYASGRLKDV